MSDKKLIYSTAELFSEYLKRRTFNIPEYQRGYKWTEENVVTLLNDLDQFKPTENDFYCLQNITVAEAKSKDSLNVIDGQQRLTTIFLLLSFLGEIGKALPSADCLRYSVRETTHEFLQKEVATRKIWSSDIVPEDAESKDQFYIAQACRAIQAWFEVHKSVKDEMAFKILYHLKIIVNQVEHEEEEIVFSSLNGGKVNLDGADLVRAILITRAVRQKYSDDPGNLEKIGSFRAKLGLELDEASRWWGIESVNNYFKQVLPNGLAKNSRFNASAYPVDLLYYAFYEAYKDKFDKVVKSEDLDVRLFENGVDFNKEKGDDHLEFYEKISEFNLTMHDWFEDDEIYNLIGYLMYNFKGVVNFSDLWNIWTSESVKTKSDFKKRLKGLIRKHISLRFEPYGDNVPLAEIPEDEIASRFQHLMDLIKKKEADWYHHSMIYPVLALADILPMEYYDKKGYCHRANIADFSRQPEEDKEHIRSQKRDLYNIQLEDMTPEQKHELEEENLLGLNSLGNLVLLHRSINRSYQNDGMGLKMYRIMGEAAIKETHIRPYTESVFRSKLGALGENSKFSEETFWSDTDVTRTYEILAERIQNYLND